jgi:Uma2 family endonuclease
MAEAVQRIPPPLSIEAFRAWIESRPDEERWELIDGAPVMMAPATRDHQRIASNLEQLLNQALKAHRSTLRAFQRVGLNLGSAAPHYDPEPDVAVIDAEPGGDPRYADRFYLAAEVVSESDRATVEGKREIYKRHSSCNCVLVIEQSRYYVRVDLRTDAKWSAGILTGPTDLLLLPEFGLRCTLQDLYDEVLPLAEDASRPR